MLWEIDFFPTFNAILLFVKVEKVKINGFYSHSNEKGWKQSFPLQLVKVPVANGPPGKHKDSCRFLLVYYL